MKIQIVDKFSYYTDKTENTIEVDEETLKQIGKTKCFDVTNQTVIDYEIPKVEISPSDKILILKQQLADTDYQAIKHADGALSDEEYEPIRKQRQSWRDEINELEKSIN